MTPILGLRCLQSARLQSHSGRQRRRRCDGWREVKRGASSALIVLALIFRTMARQAFGGPLLEEAPARLRDRQKHITVTAIRVVLHPYNIELLNSSEYQDPRYADPCVYSRPRRISCGNLENAESFYLPGEQRNPFGGREGPRTESPSTMRSSASSRR